MAFTLFLRIKINKEETEQYISILLFQDLFYNNFIMHQVVVRLSMRKYSLFISWAICYACLKVSGLLQVENQVQFTEMFHIFYSLYQHADFFVFCFFASVQLLARGLAEIAEPSVDKITWIKVFLCIFFPLTDFGTVQLNFVCCTQQTLLAVIDNTLGQF